MITINEIIMGDCGTSPPPHQVNDGYLCQLLANSINAAILPASNSVCIKSCCYVENVFSEIGEIVTTECNDKTSLLFKKTIASDTISIRLIASDGTSYSINDNTYGLLYSSFINAPLYVGFIADWNKIYNLLGAGMYHFEITQVIIGVTSTIKTIKYNLAPYSDGAANQTVRIESYNTGVILSSQFNYKLMTADLPNGWYQSFRLGGKLLPSTPKLTVDNYYDQDYQLLQIQDKVTDEFQLETYLLPSEISDQIIYDNLLANKILVSDFNIFNEKVFRSVNLYSIEITKKVS